MTESRRGRTTWRTIVEAWRLSREASPVWTSVLVVGQLIAGLALSGELVLAGIIVRRITQLESGEEASVLPLVVAFGCVIALNSVMAVVSTEARSVVSERVVFVAQRQVISAAIEMDAAAFDLPAVHDELARAHGALERESWSLVWAFVGVVGAATSIMGASVVLAVVAPLTIPVLVAATVPLLLVQWRVNRSAFRVSHDLTVNDRERRYLAALLTSRGPAHELRVFGADRILQPRFEALFEARLASLTQVARTRSWRLTLGSVVTSVGVVIAFSGLVRLIESDAITIGEASTAVLAVYQLQSRLRAITTSLGALHVSTLHMSDLSKLLRFERREGGKPAPPLTSLELVDVSFTYPGSESPSLSLVSLSIPTGGVLAIVGENGSGKTTLAKLLCGTYEPTSGEILWSGIPTTNLDRRTMWSRISVLFQDFVRYQLSGRDNVTLGGANAPDGDEHVRAVADLTGASPILDALPDGLDTRLTREFGDGVDLSVGQWQKIALARAAYRNADLLILDEPSAALDPRSEAQFFASARSVAAGKTLVIISHRLSGIANADLIVVLHAGRLVELGTHDELLARRGRYAALLSVATTDDGFDADLA